MKLKERKGITLIALVITVIVLLILAGVTIATLTGENGILTQAQNAKTVTENKNAEEKVKLAVMATISQTQDASLDLDKLKTEVTTNYGGQVEGTEFPVTVTIDGKSFTVDGDGNVGKYNERTGIEVGDYVDYTPDTESGKTYDAEKLKKGGYDSTQTVTKEDLNWRVLRKNNDGSIDLIGDATSGTVYFSGALGYNNGVYLLNDICKELYSNSTHNITSRSVNLEDMEKWLTDSGKKARADYSNEAKVKYGETKQYTGSYSYTPDIYGKTEDENANYYSEPTANTYTPASGKATNSDTLNAKQTYYKMSINPTNYGDGAKVLISSNYYWVAARFVNCFSNGASFGLRIASSSNMYGNHLFNSYDITAPNNKRLRPVVSLGSDVQITPSTEKNDESHKHTIEW